MKFTDGIKVGDRVKQKYISDCNKHNSMPATIIWLDAYNYYPNGDYSVIENRNQACILYEDGIRKTVDLDIKGCGILSPFEKVETGKYLIEGYDKDNDVYESFGSFDTYKTALNYAKWW